MSDNEPLQSLVAGIVAANRKSRSEFLGDAQELQSLVLAGQETDDFINKLESRRNSALHESVEDSEPDATNGS